MNKQEFKKRFKELYPGMRLLCIQLDGFTHRVYYDELKGNEKPIKGKCKREEYSSCMSQGEAQQYGLNNDRVCKLFEGVPNYQYQNNPKELIYVEP